MSWQYARQSAIAQWRMVSLAAAVGLSFFAVVGLSRLRMDDDLRGLLRGNDSDFQLLDEVASRFGDADRECIVRATAHSGDLFKGVALVELRQLCDSLARVDGVETVRSLFDVRRQGVAGSLLPIIPHTPNGLDQEALAAAKNRAANHPLIAGHLLSADASSSLLVVRLTAQADASAHLNAVLGQIEGVLAAARTGPAGLNFQLTGLPALRDQASQALRRDMLIFNSLGLTMAILLSATVARSLRSTVVACVPPFVGAVWAMGILGLLGVPINILTSVVPSLALVVGTCDSQRVGAACGLTSLVTAIGFASLTAARIEAVRTFGMAAAAGAIASFAAVTLLTPLLASTPFCRGIRLGKSSRLAGRAANLMAAFSIRHAPTIVVSGCLALVLLAITCLGIDADNRIADALPQGAPASEALAHVDREFGGTMGIDIVVRWPSDLGWLDPCVLDALANVHAVLDRCGLRSSLSFATVAGTLSDRAKRRLTPDAFRDMVDPESHMAIVRARVSDMGSRALEKVYDNIDAGLAALQTAQPDWQFELTGMSVVSTRNIRQLIRDLGSSLLLEVVVIGGILSLAFRSVLIGAISLIPNVFPLAVIGAWVVLSGRSLDPATVIVFNVCLGLAVDDTVHVLSAVARHRRDGISIPNAVRRAVAETGNAIVIGGLVLAIGFAAVTISSVPSLAGFGTLACAAVAAATVAELMLLPALLVVADRLSVATDSTSRISDTHTLSQSTVWTEE
ncbi:MAG: MMPL family transporter [Planctomycetia bacterium]|nr:MMPL family transporter [Planctomycetia bacterium]